MTSAAPVPAEGETLDVLLRGKVQLLQARHGYRTSVDAMVLAFFASACAPPPATCMDLGAGSGLVSILIGKHFRAIRLTLVDKQPQMIERAQRNLALAGLTGRADVRLHDIAEPLPLRDPVELVVCNPPYFQIGARMPPQNAERHIAHCETTAGIERFAEVGASQLGTGGVLCVVYPANAQKRAVQALAASGLGQIAICRVLHRPGVTEPSRILLRAERSSFLQISLLPDLYLHEVDMPDSTYERTIEAFLAGL